MGMSARHSPIVLRRRLGAELRGLRQHTGLTCAQVTLELKTKDTGTNWSETKVSRVETGRISVHPGDISELLEYYGVAGERYDDLMAMARRARQRGWWHEHGDALPDWMTVLVDLESDASAIQAHQVEVVPGLLQTRAYAHAVLAADPRARTEEEISRRVAFRLARQDLLITDEPPDYWVVLNEAVLHRQVGGPEVLVDQLGHLLEMAKQPNIAVQVLPLAAGVHVGFGAGSFVVLEFAEPTDPRVVYVDHLTGALYLEREAEVLQYAQAFEHLSALALDERDTASLLADLRRDLRR